MRLDLIEVSKITLNPDNRKTHTDEAIVSLAKKIQKTGMRVPIIINDQYEIKAGHRRYLACKTLGLEKIPCLIQDFDDEAEEWFFEITENTSAYESKLDFSGIHQDLQLFSPDDFEIEDLSIPNFRFEPSKKSEQDLEEQRMKKGMKCKRCGHPFD